METTQLLVRKNKYWLSEIGYLFFKNQVGYETYDYVEDDNDNHDEGGGGDCGALYIPVGCVDGGRAWSCVCVPVLSHGRVCLHVSGRVL